MWPVAWEVLYEECPQYLEPVPSIVCDIFKYSSPHFILYLVNNEWEGTRKEGVVA
jgi:hypothetical protein